ncbi:TetR family transcriptional regulator [Mycobacteroides abscessus subsp. bolletii]|uniref:TetR/AcrR family transcriptional regulator n=1 Tax=Mycobacteroides abscessus TaxID=36809 RepID=UPI0009D22094|nr:TetR/AcrR family transcriptional regulator [Mycobacteroides abscessus]SKX96331.1 TetR family transcriptional regulator [Mycobacteroides abscessus subsp. bolletii]
MARVPENQTRRPSDRSLRKQQLARARLIDATSKVIAEKGVEGVRLREITELADVGFGSFYNHFKSKDELVEAVVIDLMSSISQELIAHVAEIADPAEAASTAHRWFVRNASVNPETARLIVHLDRADLLFQEMITPYARTMLQTGIDTGRFKPLDLSTTLTYVVGATIAVTRGVLEGTLDTEAETASAEVLLTALGLGAEEALEISHRPLTPIFQRGGKPHATQVLPLKG